ncbi:MAG: NlpC/P60 family protein [Pseudomonadota bacterium]
MTDPRLTPANARVAAERLRGSVDAPTFAPGTPAMVNTPLVDLLREPGGARDRQLCLGEGVLVYELHQGWAYVEAVRDGYVGYLPARDVGDMPARTHRVSARATHLYAEPDFKTRERVTLSLGAMVAVTGQANDRFSATGSGLFVPTAHLTPVTEMAHDPVDVAEQLLGTPYLWGGNSSFGTDCSGLVQMACLACGIACPGDADMQEDTLGTNLSEDAPLQRGDLLFWDGHVAWMADASTLIHANAHHMATAYEPLDAALVRIEAQGDGPVTSRKRLEHFA